MNAMPSVEDVHQAVHVLYHNTDPAAKERASEWLEELQRSLFAWKISDELLHRNLDIESCYFAAQTMRTKIQFAFHELPNEDAHNSLRDSLLQQIAQITVDTNPAIATQLCLALADLALQMAPRSITANSLINELGSNIVQNPSILEILTVLPEEMTSRSLRLGSNRRSQLAEELQESGPHVLKITYDCVQNGLVRDDRIQVKVMKCFGSWLNAGLFKMAPDDEINAMHNSLIVWTFERLRDLRTPSTVHEAAADTICAALLLVEDPSIPYPMPIQQLFAGILSLEDAYTLATDEEDLDKSINFCRIFTELAESMIDNIVENAGQGFGDIRLLKLLLKCVRHYDFEVAEFTFNFWSRLSEILYKRNSDPVTNIFRPYIEELIVALCRHCQIEPDHEGVPEEGDSFSDFRMRASELIKDVVFIVGSSCCFRQMFNNLQNQGVAATWDVSEASLFIMTAVARNILPNEEEVVPQVVRAILGLPENTHLAIRYTSIQLLGELADWLQSHPDMLELVLRFLLPCLQQKLLCTVAANSLQAICTVCRDQIGDFHFQGLVQIVQVMDTFSISNEAAIGLLKAATVILLRMQLEHAQEGLRQLCFVQANALSKILKGEQLPEGKNDPTLWLDRLAAIFRHFHPEVREGQTHPCIPVLQEIWCVLSGTWSKYPTDARIIERCCRCLRFAVRSVGRNTLPFLDQLVARMIEMYQLHQHSCFLYLGSILVDEYAHDAACAALLLGMLQTFWARTFPLLNAPNGLRDHPDTVDDLFRLCTRFVQRSPVQFLQSPVVESVVQCALTAVMLDHREANASVLKFLNDVVAASRRKPEAEDYALRRQLVLKIVTDNGQTLVQNLLNAALFRLPSYMILDMADLIYELMQLDRVAVCHWLEATLLALPTVTVTTQELRKFHTEVTSAESERMVKSAMHDLIHLYR